MAYSPFSDPPEGVSSKGFRRKFNATLHLVGPRIAPELDRRTGFRDNPSHTTYARVFHDDVPASQGFTLRTGARCTPASDHVCGRITWDVFHVTAARRPLTQHACRNSALPDFLSIPRHMVPQEFITRVGKRITTYHSCRPLNATRARYRFRSRASQPPRTPHVALLI